MSEDGICVVTQPARRETGKNHAYTLLNILSAITSVSVLTANLSSDSSIREEYETVELGQKGTGDSIPVAAFRFVVNQMKMCAAIRKRPEEKVLFFGATSYILPIIFARIIGKTVIVEPRGDVPLSLRLKWEEQVPKPVARILAGLVKTLEHIGYWASNAIITYTPAMAEELGLEKYEDKLYTNGARYIDTEKFSVQVQYEERDNFVGFVGRLDVEKGVDKLVEVAEKLPEDVRFLFVGDGDYREMLENRLSDEIERGTVETVGWVDHDEVPEQLNRLKLHILLSDSTEGLPTIILESFGCGTPVYSTSVSGVPDVVKEGETGFLMENDELDTDKVADKITEILSRDDLRSISRNCRSVAEDDYSFDAAVRRYKDILNDLS
ncbi:MAG: glycosyltransferase [Halobacteria archaeon]|nr:glycosyltransferase [Halobacteria archaeon]